MIAGILITAYLLCLVVAAADVILSRRRFKAAVAQRDQLAEMLREAHAFIDFLGETQARVVADAVRRDIDDQRALLGEKRRSN